MSPVWTPRTFKDMHRLPDNPLIEAPCCGRCVPANMLILACMQPIDLGPEGRCACGCGHRFHCDRCKQVLFLTGATTREEYFGRHRDAPEAIIEKMRNTDQELRGGLRPE